MFRVTTSLNDKLWLKRGLRSLKLPRLCNFFLNGPSLESQPKLKAYKGGTSYRDKLVEESESGKNWPENWWLTESAENRARSLRVKLVRLGGTAGGGGLRVRLASRDSDPRETPRGGSAGGSPRLPLPSCPFILCGRMGELVASCDAVTDFVFSVPVLLLVIAFVVLDWNIKNYQASGLNWKGTHHGHLYFWNESWAVDTAQLVEQLLTTIDIVVHIPLSAQFLYNSSANWNDKVKYEGWRGL